jgi:hypothetical protein
VNIAIVEESASVARITEGMTFSAHETGPHTTLLSRLGGESAIALAKVQVETDALGSVQQQHEISVCDDEETYIYETYDPTDPNDESLGWYDWLADSVTTSHICNDRKSFTTYQPKNTLQLLE